MSARWIPRPAGDGHDRGPAQPADTVRLSNSEPAATIWPAIEPARWLQPGVLTMANGAIRRQSVATSGGGSVGLDEDAHPARHGRPVGRVDEVDVEAVDRACRHVAGCADFWTFFETDHRRDARQGASFGSSATVPSTP